MTNTPQNKENLSYTLPLIIGLVLIGVMIGVRWWVLARPAMVLPPAEKIYRGVSKAELKHVVDSVFTKNGVKLKLVRQTADGFEVWFAETPYGLPIPAVHLSMQEAFDSLKVEIIRAESNPVNSNVRLYLGWQDSCLFQVQLSSALEPEPVRKVARIALIIDDFGSIWGEREIKFTQLGIDLTVSVIPGAGRSRQVSKEMAKRGCEVLLHMPMEPYNIIVEDDGYLITNGMSVAEIESRFRKAISEVPDLVGINNHMGSKVSSHPATIANVLSVIKKEGLFFIDSRTYAGTVAYTTARSMGITSGSRDIFLDVDNSEAEIMQQIRDLKRKARTNGSAIAIGHCRRTTLRILQREIPKLKNEGYEFVFVSQLIK